MVLSSGDTRKVAISSALSLSLSHIPVQIVKKMFPRKRPYLILEKTNFHENPLQDHSFPSGHTTAIFSVIIPFIIFIPIIAFSINSFRGFCRIIKNLFRPSLPFRCICRSDSRLMYGKFVLLRIDVILMSSARRPLTNVLSASPSDHSA